MRGELPIVAVNGWDNRFEQAPDQSSATFSGQLDRGTGWCAFTVRLAATAPHQVRTEAGIPGSIGGTPFAGTHDGHALVRAASATLESDCWPDLTGGTGEIWRNVVSV